MQIKKLIVLLTLFAVSSCKSNNAELIAKKWRPVAISFPLNDSTKKELFAKTVIEFTKDGKYIINGPQMNDTGTYALTDNGKTLTVTGGSKSQNIEMSIDTLTNDKFVFTTKADGSSTTTVPVK